jgi:hypothetical protein
MHAGNAHPSTVPTAPALPGTWFMGLKPHAVVAACLQQVFLFPEKMRRLLRKAVLLGGWI